VSGTINPYEAQANNGTAGGLTHAWSQLTSFIQQDIQFRLWNIDTGTVNSDVRSSDPERKFFTSRNFCIPYLQTKARHQNDLVEQPVTYRRPPITVEPRTNFSSITLTDKTLTLVKSSLTDDEAMIDGFMPGDIIRDPDSCMVFFIRSRSGTTVIAEAQNNYVDDGLGGFDTIKAFSTSTASGNLVFLNTRIFFAGNEGWVDFDTSVDPSVYRRADGDVTFLTNATTGVVDRTTDGVLGDYLYVDPILENNLVGSEMEIVTISGGTIDFARGSAPRQDNNKFFMRAFIRKPVANV
jgi:hypothetical protein